MSFQFKSLAEVGDQAIVQGHNSFDHKDGKKIPTGGYVDFLIPNRHALTIRWQDGPVDREAGEEPNGAFVEDVLKVCKIRIDHYQDSDFACEDNAKASEHIQKAIDILGKRHAERKARGVLGKNEQ